MDVKLVQVIKAIQNKIGRYERKVFRGIYGPIKLNGEWQIR
jgi:hypothetical protein